MLGIIKGKLFINVRLNDTLIALNLYNTYTRKARLMPFSKYFPISPIAYLFIKRRNRFRRPVRLAFEGDEKTGFQSKTTGLLTNRKCQS